jgi:hypothetical protein
MSSGAKRAIGTKLKLGNGGSPESFAAVPEITSLSLGGTKVDIIDTTNMDSPADAVTGLIFREKLGGLADGGEVSFSMNFLPTSTAQIAFRAAIDGLLHNFQIVLPAGAGGGTFSFAGFVSGFDNDFAIDKQLTASGKITISGPTSFA